MAENRKEQRRKGERRKDIASAKTYFGMERRMFERRRSERRHSAFAYFPPK
jgi:hypothetical protein